MPCSQLRLLLVKVCACHPQLVVLHVQQLNLQLKDVITHELKAVHVRFLTLHMCAFQAPYLRLEYWRWLFNTSAPTMGRCRRSSWTPPGPHW